MNEDEDIKESVHRLIDLVTHLAIQTQAFEKAVLFANQQLFQNCGVSVPEHGGYEAWVGKMKEDLVKKAMFLLEDGDPTSATRVQRLMNYLNDDDPLKEGSN